MPPKRRGRPPGSTKLNTSKSKKQTLKEKLIIIVGNDELDDSMIKVESWSNDDSGNFTNGGETDDQTELIISEEKSKVCPFLSYYRKLSYYFMLTGTSKFPGL